MHTRCDLSNPAGVAEFPPEQRECEVAAILAAGVIRMRLRRGTASSSRRRGTSMSQISPEPGETRLELSRRSGPDGQCG